jgi:hypothetical protein
MDVILKDINVCNLLILFQLRDNSHSCEMEVVYLMGKLEKLIKSGRVGVAPAVTGAKLTACRNLQL